MFIVEKISVKVNNTLYNVQLHRSVTLKCSVSGTPSPYSVSWIKVTDGTETVLKNMPFQEGINIYEISIDNATDKDAGIYQCKAMSKEREIQSENIHVFVFGGTICYILLGIIKSACYIFHKSKSLFLIYLNQNGQKPNILKLSLFINLYSCGVI